MARTTSPTPATVPHTELLARMMTTVETESHQIWLVARSLQALANLATCGDPRHTRLGVLHSEDLGALFELLSHCTLRTSRGLADQVKASMDACDGARA